MEASMQISPIPLSILVIDENRLRASIIEAGLRDAGYNNLQVVHDVVGIGRRIADIEPDVIVIDQTAPEHQRCGLHCVKILMPGLLPMTFGEENRRVTGLERLHQVPFTLGYQDHPLTNAEINPHPHPFS